MTQLFTEGRAVATALIWVIYFMNLLNLYFLNSWLPTIISDAGIPVSTAIQLTSLFQIGGIGGALVLGRVLDRRFSFWILAGVLHVGRRVHLSDWTCGRVGAAAGRDDCVRWARHHRRAERLSRAERRSSIPPACARRVLDGHSASAASDRSSARWSEGSCWRRGRRRGRCSGPQPCRPSSPRRRPRP